jgi:hypothetical protein
MDPPGHSLRQFVPPTQMRSVQITVPTSVLNVPVR